MPASARASARPASTALSGPITTRSAAISRASATCPATSVGAIGLSSASVAMPGLPGAQTSRVVSGDWSIFQARACSRPPDPTTRMFMRAALARAFHAVNSLPRPPRSGRRAGLRHGRKVDAERRPLARRALDGQAAAVAVDDVFDDGEPKPGAGPLARLLPLHPIEPLGQPGQMLPRDARTGVRDAQRNVSLLRSMVGG